MGHAPYVMVHDTRVEGTYNPRESEQTVTTDGSEELSHLVSRLVTIAGKTPFRFLSILAHGIAATSCGSGLGYGIQLCKEHLVLDTVNTLLPLRGKAEMVVIHSCGAARIASGSSGTTGNGDHLCRRIAQTIRARVMASTEYQLPRPSWRRVIELGGWEGLVVTYSPDGRLLRSHTRRFPSAYVNTDGEWVGNE